MSQLTLLRQRKFFPLFWTQFFGAFNDNFLKNSLVILITFQASQVMGIPATQMVSVAGGIFILPFFLFSATAGQLADKYEKGKIIRIIKLVEIGIMALATYGFMSHHFEFLLLVLFLMGLHSTFFGPLKFSILPQHLGERELMGGNALIEAGTFLSILLGTIAGGILISIPEHGPVYVSIGLLTVSVLGFAASWLIPEARAVDPGLKVQWNPLTPTIDILKFTKKTRSVFLSILGISWFWFFGAAILSLFPPYCKEVLRTNESVVTLFLGVFSVGIAIGSLLCEKLSRQSIELGLVPLGSIGITLFAWDLSVSGRPEAFASLVAGAGAWEFMKYAQGIHVLLDLLLLAIFSGLFIVPMYAMMQDRSDPSHRSRIIAGNNILNALFMVLSSGMLVGFMKWGWTIPQMFLVLAGLNGLVAIYIYTLLPEFLIRFATWILANCMYRLRVEGAGNIPDKGPAVLVCNHVSFVDWLILGAGVHRPVRFVMHHSFARNRIAKFLLKQAKVIPIASAKESPAVLEAALRKIAFELRDQEIVCIFPEGQITRDGHLSPFRSGVEKIIQETPVPVIPMALRGMWGSFFSRKEGAAMSKAPRRFWSRVTLAIDEPLTPEEVSARTLQEKVENLLKDV
jgi:1-acyl-sn-glycerol-3-phosphate acyltransferase